MAQSRNMMRSFKQFLIIATIFITILLILIEISIVIFPNFPPFPVHMLTYKFHLADKISAKNIETKLIYSGSDDEMNIMKNILLTSVPDALKKDFESAKKILGYMLDYTLFNKSEIQSKTPLDKFRECKAGKSGLCFDFNKIYFGFLRAAGYKSRILLLQSNLLFQYGYLHTNVEVFIPEYNKWVVIDPSFGCYFTFDGVPMSSIEINHLLLENLERVNDIKVNYIKYKKNLPKWNKSLFLMYNNIMFIEKYLLPVIKNKSILTDFKNIVVHSTNVYIYSDTKRHEQENLLRILNVGYALVKIIFPLLIVFNCIVLCAIFLKRHIR